MTEFFTHFFISNISISFALLLMIFVRFMFRKQLTCNGRYNTIYIVLFLLVIPFIPVNNSFIFQAIGFIRSLFNRSTSAENTVTPVPINTSPSLNVNWMNDFAISVNSTSTISKAPFYYMAFRSLHIFHPFNSVRHITIQAEKICCSSHRRYCHIEYIFGMP